MIRFIYKKYREHTTKKKQTKSTLNINIRAHICIILINYKLTYYLKLYLLISTYSLKKRNHLRVRSIGKGALGSTVIWTLVYWVPNRVNTGNSVPLMFQCATPQLIPFRQKLRVAPPAFQKTNCTPTVSPGLNLNPQSSRFGSLTLNFLPIPGTIPQYDCELVGQAEGINPFLCDTPKKISSSSPKLSSLTSQQYLPDLEYPRVPKQLEYQLSPVFWTVRLLLLSLRVVGCSDIKQSSKLRCARNSSFAFSGTYSSQRVFPNSCILYEEQTSLTLQKWAGLTCRVSRMCFLILSMGVYMLAFSVIVFRSPKKVLTSIFIDFCKALWGTYTDTLLDFSIRRAMIELYCYYLGVVGAQGQLVTGSIPVKLVGSGDERPGSAGSIWEVASFEGKGLLGGSNIQLQNSKLSFLVLNPELEMVRSSPGSATSSTWLETARSTKPCDRSRGTDPEDRLSVWTILVDKGYFSGTRVQQPMDCTQQTAWVFLLIESISFNGNPLIILKLHKFRF